MTFICIIILLVLIVGDETEHNMCALQHGLDNVI